MPQPKPKKMGRPKLPKGDAKDRIVPVRFNTHELKRLEAAAKSDQKTISEWIRGTVAMRFAEANCRALPGASGLGPARSRPGILHR